MKLTSELTDAAIQRELGARLERRRIDADLTQAHLAEEAGVSKSTVERFEAGRITDFVRLIRVLRVLKLIDRLDQLILDLPQSPIVLLKHKRRERQRVGRPRRSDNNAAPKPTTPWTWGK